MLFRSVAAYGTAVRLAHQETSTDQIDDDSMSDTAEHDFSAAWPEQSDTRPRAVPE